MEDPSKSDINSSGFGGGEHRMLLADYNFVDPGVYAEDKIPHGTSLIIIPDLDGDGIGEGYVSIKVDSLN